MTLAERLNIIIQEQNISKADFAKRVGITRNYIIFRVHFLFLFITHQLYHNSPRERAFILPLIWR